MSEEAGTRSLERFSAAVAALMSPVGGRTREDLLARLARQAAELLDAEACAVFLVERGHSLALAARHGHLEDEPADRLGELPLTDDPAESLCGYVARQGKVFSAGGESLHRQRAQPEGTFLRVPSGESRSLLCVPLLKGAGEVVGLLRLANKLEAGGGPRASGFDAEDERLARAYALAAAAAIENLRQFERLEKLQRAARAAAEATALREPNELLRAVVEGTRDALNSDAVTLYTYDPDRGDFDYPPAMAGVGREDEVVALGRVPERSAVRQVLRLPERHIAPDAQDDPLLDRRFVRREGIQSAVAIPLRAADSPVGVLFVHYRTRRRFTDDELRNINLFAQQAAVAVGNAQLYERARRRADRLQVLNEAGRAITSSLDFEEILGRIAEEACKLASYKGAGPSFADIRLVEGGRALLAAARPREEQERIRAGLGDSLEASVGIVGRALRTGAPQLVNEVLKDPDYVSILEETRSQLVVPIKQEATVIGTLNVEHPAANAFDGEAVRVLEALASQAAIAIENARQFEELNKARTQVVAQTALTWMGMVSASWGHSIRRDAATIRGATELLRRYIAEGSPDESARLNGLALIDHIDRAGEKILNLPMTPPLSSGAGVRTVSLNDFVTEYVERLKRREAYTSLELSLELGGAGRPSININPAWLRETFDIIADNAARAMSRSPRRSLKICVAARGGAAEISFRDTGHGIPPEIRSKLLHAPVRRAAENAGLGMGLLIARTIVEAFNGELRVVETGPRGTTFGISFPLAQ